MREDGSADEGLGEALALATKEAEEYRENGAVVKCAHAGPMLCCLGMRLAAFVPSPHSRTPNRAQCTVIGLCPYHICVLGIMKLAL